MATEPVNKEGMTDEAFVRMKDEMMLREATKLLRPASPPGSRGQRGPPPEGDALIQALTEPTTIPDFPFKDDDNDKDNSATVPAPAKDLSTAEELALKVKKQQKLLNNTQRELEVAKSKLRMMWEMYADVTDATKIMDEKRTKLAEAYVTRTQRDAEYAIRLHELGQAKMNCLLEVEEELMRGPKPHLPTLAAMVAASGVALHYTWKNTGTLLLAHHAGVPKTELERMLRRQLINASIAVLLMVFVVWRGGRARDHPIATMGLLAVGLMASGAAASFVLLVRFGEVALSLLVAQFAVGMQAGMLLGIILLYILGFY